MPRQVHSSGRRLRESNTLILVAELLKRGARSRTVETLTGQRRIAIRDVYRELFGVSPPKGPGDHRPDHFTKDHLQQFQSSVARVCLAAAHESRRKPVTGPSPELGQLYCDAYDQYLAHMAPVQHFIEPLCFDRFTQLARVLQSKEALAIKKCVRCGTEFVAPAQPGAGNQRHCGFCRITTTRGCSRCDTYVPLDEGYCPPKRRPMCAEHVTKYRPAYAMKHASIVAALRASQLAERPDPPSVSVRKRSKPRRAKAKSAA